MNQKTTHAGLGPEELDVEVGKEDESEIEYAATAKNERIQMDIEKRSKE